jgi:hypothetical protein
MLNEIGQPLINETSKGAGHKVNQTVMARATAEPNQLELWSHWTLVSKRPNSKPFSPWE